jgi:hypothetical protein
MKNNKINRDETGTAYITDADGQTRVYAIELDNDEGWVLERQEVGGDENPQRLSEHATEDEALTELATYGATE